MTIEEAIKKMNEKIEEVKEAAAERRPLISPEDQQKLDAILDKTVKVVTEAGNKVEETVNSLGNSANVDEFLDRVQAKCAAACDYTISKIHEFQDDPATRSKLEEASKEIDDSFDNLMENEDVKRIVDTIKNAGTNVKETLDGYFNKPETQESIHRAKKAILDVAEKAMEGLRKALDDGEKTVKEAETVTIEVEETEEKPEEPCCCEEKPEEPCCCEEKGEEPCCCDEKPEGPETPQE
ncbi:MAG: hypothetical protein IKE21_06200 [Erysipelotrichaceae bacterium]|nr:hypothetical protein [Erysipelotrichaceae bacterium]